MWRPSLKCFPSSWRTNRWVLLWPALQLYETMMQISDVAAKLLDLPCSHSAKLSFLVGFAWGLFLCHSMHQLKISDLPSAKIVQEKMLHPNGWNLLYFSVSHEICPLFDISEPEIKEISVISGHYKTFSECNTTTEIAQMTLRVTLFCCKSRHKELLPRFPRMYQCKWGITPEL